MFVTFVVLFFLGICAMIVPDFQDAGLGSSHQMDWRLAVGVSGCRNDLRLFPWPEPERMGPSDLVLILM